MIPFLRKLLVQGSLEVGFFLVRDNAISELGIDFEKH
jgi:hypothetical protein